MVWFALLLKNQYKNKKNKIIKNLNKKGIETRPIISGNFLNQSASKLYNSEKTNFFLMQNI